MEMSRAGKFKNKRHQRKEVGDTKAKINFIVGEARQEDKDERSLT